MSGPDDDALMRAALDEARAAGEAGEVPVGAALALDGRILARAGNRTLRDGDPTAHAEVVVLREAARAAGNHRLAGATLAVTLEPCLMCCGAAVQARIARVIWAARDEKAGAVHLLGSELEQGRLNHRVEQGQGPFGPEASELLRAFFRERR